MNGRKYFKHYLGVCVQDYSCGKFWKPLLWVLVFVFVCLAFGPVGPGIASFMWCCPLDYNSKGKRDNLHL